MSRTPLSAVTGNRLLDRLPVSVLARVRPHCELVSLPVGRLLGEPGHDHPYVYFPAGSVISSVLPMEGEHVIEVCLIGREGLHGAALARGVARSVVRGEVRLAGDAWRMPVADFRAACKAHPALGSAVDAYLQALMGQIVQAAGCNRFHRVDQRLARWLLMTSDRAALPTFPLTHRLLGNALGVRRVGVTNAAGDLQRDGFISYARGMVTILDRRGLEGASCGCYRKDLDTYERALPTRTVTEQRAVR